MLPSATLQGVTWLLCAAWLARYGATGRSLQWLPWLGVVAAIFLVVYGTFLGTEGDMYRWLRRYGTIVYFGLTYVCVLIASGHVQRLVRSGALAVPARMDVVLMVLAGLTMLVAIAHVFVAPMLEEQAQGQSGERGRVGHRPFVRAVFSRARLAMAVRAPVPAPAGLSWRRVGKPARRESRPPVSAGMKTGTARCPSRYPPFQLLAVGRLTRRRDANGRAVH